MSYKQGRADIFFIAGQDGGPKADGAAWVVRYGAATISPPARVPGPVLKPSLLVTDHRVNDFGRVQSGQCDKPV